jgi:ATP-dependent DNA helicase DinG
LEAVYSILSRRNCVKNLDAAARLISGSSSQRVQGKHQSVLLGMGITGRYQHEGKSLSNVVIFRLPFPVPDPIINYKASIERNALMDVNVPEMVIKLKQGIGRLIRNFTDTGIVCIIDPRLRDVPAERYHDIAWTHPFPLKTEQKCLDMLRKFMRAFRLHITKQRGNLTWKSKRLLVLLSPMKIRSYTKIAPTSWFPRWPI